MADNYQIRQMAEERLRDERHRREHRNQVIGWVCIALVLIVASVSLSFVLYTEVTTAEPVQPGLVEGALLSCVVE